MECVDGVCKLVPKLKVGVFQVVEDAVMLEWTPRNAGPYKIEIQEDNGDWRVLLEASSNSFLRKKGLKNGRDYNFRVSNKSSSVEITVTPSMSPGAPTVHATAKDDGNLGVMIGWQPVSNAVEYAVQLREMSGGLEWNTLSESIKGTRLRKNNLTPAKDYVVRYRAHLSNGNWSNWSSPSTTTEVGNVDSSFSKLFGDTLMRGNQRVPVNALAGKTVAVYFSAHWCPPCRQQTANMKEFYKFVQSQNYPFEVVFISADRDKSGFNTYFGEMPWLALPYESPRREQIMQTYQVSGIPKLMIFGPKGNLISENAAGVPLTKELLDSWVYRN